MKSSRWLLLAAAVLLLLGAGMMAWQLARKLPEAKPSKGRLIGSMDMPSKSWSRAAGKRTKKRESIHSLPPHLREFVRIFEERNRELLEREDIYVLDYLAAVEAAKPLVNRLSRKDVRRLLNYYWQLDQGSDNGYHLIGTVLLEHWGKIDPRDASAFVASDLRHGLARLQNEIELGDPFAEVPGMEMEIHEIAAVFAGWASRAPREALAGWLALAPEIENHSLVKNPGSVDGQVQHAISLAWSAASPREAWENLVELGRVGKEWSIGFSKGLDDDAPWTWIARQITTSPGLANEAVFAGEWARHDPQAALSWITEYQPEHLSEALEHWHGEDYTKQAWNWVQQHSAQLSPDLRLVHLRAAVSAGVGQEQELLPMLNSLPREEATWRFLLDLAEGSANPFEGTLASEHLRTVIDTLQPPEDTRTLLEATLANRVLPNDPFADDDFPHDPFAED